MFLFRYGNPHNVSELVAIATALVPKYEGRVGNPAFRANCGNISTIAEDGVKTRDLAAAKAGLGSGKTYEAAKRVVMDGAPELVKAMDEGAHLKSHPCECGLEELLGEVGDGYGQNSA